MEETQRRNRCDHVESSRKQLKGKEGVKGQRWWYTGSEKVWDDERDEEGKSEIFRVKESKRKRDLP